MEGRSEYAFCHRIPITHGATSTTPSIREVAYERQEIDNIHTSVGCMRLQQPTVEREVRGPSAKRMRILSLDGENKIKSPVTHMTEVGET